jgi:DNA recombination protein RmuC
MPMLRVVANLWGLQRQNLFSRELAEQAGKVHDKLAGFIDSMDKLGNQIDGVHKSYRKAFDQLKDGRGSLVRQVERFVELGAKASKKLPASVSQTDDALPDLSDE